MSPQWSGRRVLIVDDEELISMELSSHFVELGFIVCGTANTAPSALRSAETLKPDLVTMDINLGAPGEGIAAVTLMRMTDLDTPILFITGGLELGTDDTIRSLGRAECVAKPFERQNLLDGLLRLFSPDQGARY